MISQPPILSVTDEASHLIRLIHRRSGREAYNLEEGFRSGQNMRFGGGSYLARPLASLQGIPQSDLYEYGSKPYYPLARWMAVIHHSRANKHGTGNVLCATARKKTSGIKLQNQSQALKRSPQGFLDSGWKSNQSLGIGGWRGS